MNNQEHIQANRHNMHNQEHIQDTRHIITQKKSTINIRLIPSQSKVNKDSISIRPNKSEWHHFKIIKA